MSVIARWDMSSSMSTRSAGAMSRRCFCQSAPLAVSAVAGRHIAGLARLEDRLLIILRIETLMRPEELTVAGGPG